MMLVLKIIGSLTIIVSCSLIGNHVANKYSNRLSNLKNLKYCIQILETEIVYLSTPLPEALKNVYRKGNKSVSFIFKQIRDYLISNKEHDVLDSFIFICNLYKNNLNLNKEDIEILISLGRILGKSDKEDQKKYFKLVLKELSIQREDAEEKMKKNENMYKKLGILSGLAIVIILF